MSHPDEGLLQELLDGELAPAAAAAVRAHSSGCAPCAAALEELQAMQVEADAIVSRLPLDPPLVRPHQVARPRRTVNLRLIGLAASAVLVAGTSWVLLRSSPDAASGAPIRDEVASGVALPMPQQERQEVPAATPVAPAAPPPAEREQKPAAQSVDTRSLAVAPEKQAKAKEEDRAAAKDAQAAGQAEAPPGAAPLANAAAPAARLAPAAPASAPGLAASAPLTLGDAAQKLGWKVQSIEGLAPVSIEIVGSGPDSTQALVQHYVMNGTPVLLTQRRPIAAVDVTNRGARRVDATELTARAARNSEVWTSGGILLELEAALPGDALAALQKRVK